MEISASRGIKQGCLVAPLVWALVTGRFLYLLALATDPLWVAQDVTAYADDFHSGSKVHNVAGLDRLVLRLGHLLDVLANAGLNINALKSAVLYRFKGTFCTHVVENSGSVHQRRGSLYRLRTPGGALYEFPVVSTHTHLGTVLVTKTRAPRRCSIACNWPSWNGPGFQASPSCVLQAWSFPSGPASDLALQCASHTLVWPRELGHTALLLSGHCTCANFGQLCAVRPTLASLATEMSCVRLVSQMWAKSCYRRWSAYLTNYRSSQVPTPSW